MRLNRIPTGFVKVGATTYGPNHRGIIYWVTAENGTTYEVSRHEWVLPTRRWAWKAVPQGLSGANADSKAIYFDTLADGECELFPDRVEREEVNRT